MSTETNFRSIFSAFDQKHSAQPPSPTDCSGVSWVRDLEEKGTLPVGKTHEFILEQLKKNPSVVALLDFYSREDLAAKVTTFKNVDITAQAILLTLKLPILSNEAYFSQLMGQVYTEHFASLKTDQQETEINNYGVVSGLLRGMKEALNIEDPHAKFGKLKEMLPELKTLHGQEDHHAIESQSHKWEYTLQKEKHAAELKPHQEVNLFYDSFFHSKFILGIVSVIFVSNLYLFRSEQFNFKIVGAVLGWTVYSSVLAWLAVSILRLGIRKIAHVTTGVFRYVIPALKPSLHPLSTAMNQFITAELPRCYESVLPQLIDKWQETVLAQYFPSKAIS
jgi:hypothetical protein